jgi:hypothetical protein
VQGSELDAIEQEMAAELERMRANGLAAPFPTGIEAREFKD